LRSRTERFSPRRMIPEKWRPVRTGSHASIRETKRRKTHAVHCPHRRRQVYAVCANRLPMRKRSQRGPLASRRSAAALAPATERQDSAQAALHAKHDTKALPSPRIALKRCTSHPGRCAGGVDARAAWKRERRAPARRNRTRSVSRRHRLTSLNDERDGAVIVIAAAKSKDLNLCR
jgi:hypothetical protein